MEVITANSKEVTKCSVLVVDDDVKYLLAISRILKTQGYDIFKAKCGQEALDILDKSRPDLIVLDIQLPDIDGYELARRLNENPETKDIPVMFLTGSSEVLDILTGFQTGAVDYISKPVNYLELLARLETQVKLKQRRDKIISMNKQLQEEIQERKRVEQALIEKTHQLEQLNKFLETRVKEEVEKRRSHEGVLLHRSKLEALGEMVGAIAHQWRQPLSTVGFIIENILDDLELGELEGEALEISLNKAVNQIQFMSKVIEGFINFYKPSRIKESFDVVSTVAETISILSPEMERRTIQIQSSCDVESLVIKGYSNDFKQIVFNIINNGKDVIMEREQRGLMSKEEGKIAVTVTCDDKNAIVKISDNGGGVPEEIKNKIFVPFFSTKTEKKGLGIGLYLVKTIIADHMKGSIEVDNTDIGAQFTIKLPRFKKD